ncbi:MAG TPA: winged helix-turn-helix domain-containing protein [Bryobacteraceae bacterium]|nr:winged helix-turn-helix domain-containing protein [Bryobacteraceae bacterium]
MPNDVRGRVFRFGVFEADAARGELRKHGVRIKLHAQPFQVLVMLLEKPSELVTREEMRRRLWGEDTFVDFDHGLNSAVNKIRDALDDSASQPRYVETVSGKGYRFIAPVSRDPAASSGTSAVAEAIDKPAPTVLSTPEELPAASRKLVRTLLLLVQALYLAFYVGALANLREIGDIFLEERLPAPSVLMAVVVTTAAVLIPVRLFLITAVAFDFRQLPSKFARMFPVLLIFDLLWAVSPFLLVHHVSTGLALGMSATLVYLPFAQRSLVLMYGRGQ